MQKRQPPYLKLTLSWRNCKKTVKCPPVNTALILIIYPTIYYQYVDG